MLNTTIRKSDLARELGVSRARVSQLVRRGMPVRPDGFLDRAAALNWVRLNVDIIRQIGQGMRVDAPRHPPWWPLRPMTEEELGVQLEQFSSRELISLLEGRK